MRLSVYEMREITIGSVKVNRVLVYAHDFSALRAYLGPDVQFFIGNNLILGKNWVLDLKSNQWSVQDYAHEP
jgi:hypothetical protein